MCGIVGVINNSKKHEWGARAAFIQALYAGAVRGQHSTGVFKVINNKIAWEKAAMASSDFLQTKKMEEDFLPGIGMCSFLVGHTRFATRGNVEDKNAHPFEEGHITLVHNGTLTGVWNLPGGLNYNVDSEAICHSIKIQGIEATSPQLAGAYALVWYDTKKKTLNLLRNDERPLFLVNCDRNVTFFGSEEGMLKWIAERNGYEVIQSFPLPINEVWSFQERVTKPKITKVKPANKVSTFMESFTDVFTKEIRGTVGKVVPFQQPKLPKIPANDDVLSVKIGDVVFFSVDDFDDKAGSKFVPITGSLPFKDHKQYRVVGNFSGDIEALFSSKKLFSGIITATNVWNSIGIQLDVKEIKESDIPDPFFMNEAEKKEWKKIHGKKIEKKKLTYVCEGGCGKDLTEGFVRIWKTGGSKMVCMDCYKKPNQVEVN